jgi:hypothetical protein
MKKSLQIFYLRQTMGQARLAPLLVEVDFQKKNGKNSDIFQILDENIRIFADMPTFYCKNKTIKINLLSNI